MTVVGTVCCSLLYCFQALVCMMTSEGWKTQGSHCCCSHACMQELETSMCCNAAISADSPTLLQAHIHLSLCCIPFKVSSPKHSSTKLHHSQDPLHRTTAINMAQETRLMPGPLLFKCSAPLSVVRSLSRVSLTIQQQQQQGTPSPA